MRSFIFSAWQTSASDWRNDKGQIVLSETPFFLGIKLWYSTACTTLSLTYVSPGTVPVRSLRSFYIKQQCVAYSSVMLPSKPYTVLGLAVTCVFFFTLLVWMAGVCRGSTGGTGIRFGDAGPCQLSQPDIVPLAILCAAVVGTVIPAGLSAVTCLVISSEAYSGVWITVTYINHNPASNQAARSCTGMCLLMEDTQSWDSTSSTVCAPLHYGQCFLPTLRERSRC